jgi:CHAD domain-containing protein/adenylate cyclase class IV
MTDVAEGAVGSPGEAEPGAEVDARARPIEVELKFRMTDTGAGERLLAADDLAGFAARGPVTTVLHEDRYLDTNDGRLAAAGYAGRLRSSVDGTVITLKGLRGIDDGGGVHRREELEGPADPAVAPAGWAASAARDRVVELVGELVLEDLVTVRQSRRKRDYEHDGTVAELSVDDVEVVAGGRVLERFAELELELREGSEAALEALADLLSEIEELVPAETSKLERALEAVRRAQAGDGDGGEAGGGGDGGGTREPVPVGPGVTSTEPEASVEIAAEPEPEAPRIIVPKSPGVLGDDHLAEAGRKVLRFHLARMITREPGTRAGRDSEELHAMRVATRRQRAAWRVFGEAFDPKRTAKHRRRLREVAADLGAVRDLDVLIDAGEAYRDAQGAAEAAAFDPLIESWRARRETARAILIRELDSNGYRRWVEGYLLFVQAEGQGVLPVGPTQPHRVRDTMPSRIWTAYEGVRAYEPVLRWADVTTLHDLRISAKWLRYTLEFAREALGRDAGPVIEKIVALQDHLGWLHDADVAAGLARQFLVEHAGELTELESAAIGRYLVDRERELARLRRTVGGPWRGVSSLAFRRALGRLVAGL